MVSSNRLLSCFLGFCYAYAFGWSAFAAESEVLGRVHIEENHFGKVVVAADDQPMRGTSVMMNKYQRHNGETRYFYDPEYWQMLRANGITALRIAVFDPWQRAHGDPGDTTPYPHGDFSDLYDQAEMFYELDYLIETAGKHGMSVLVNYHNTGGYRDPDHSQPTNEKGEFPYLESMDEVVNFWELVAPRYANRTHVFYEPLNEYAKWRPDNYTDEVLGDTYRIYEVIRQRAPQTHIVLLSFANHIPQDPVKHSMLKTARKLAALGVDFSNASVAFHPYNPKPEHVNPEKYILELMAEYPVINTEQNFPVKSIEELDWLDASGLEGDKLGVQSMERLGISWFHWNIDTPKRFRDYYIGKLLPDAKEKGYLWQAASQEHEADPVPE